MATSEQMIEQPLRRTRRFGRRVAALVAVAIIGVLALGWFADALGQVAPRATFTNGETRQAGLYRVALTIDSVPARAGEAATLIARVEDGDGHLADGLTTRLVMTMPTMEMASLETSLQPSSSGAYWAQTVFPMAGEWLVRVELTSPGAAPIHADFSVPVR
jgi:nitrogen fixation protein FixH